MALGLLKPRESAHQACEHAIRSAVIAGELVPGERLPPERELAIKLGVSRLTLRSALAALTTRGLLAVKHGSGYIVQDYTVKGGADLLPDLASDSPPIATELLRVRRHLARAVLEHFVANPPAKAAIAKVDAAVAAMAAVAAQHRPAAELATADLEVIRALIAATGSPVLALCLNPVINVIASSARLREALYGEPATNVVGWRVLVDWLAKPRQSTLDPLLQYLETHDATTVDRLRRRRPR
ncbi:MAG: GntR family transcriptional regulator [Myxococcota bacterium]|nr:GntR family transcriptional regulator [Myxococcota bacterium]